MGVVYSTQNLELNNMDVSGDYAQISLRSLVDHWRVDYNAFFFVIFRALTTEHEDLHIVT